MKQSILVLFWVFASMISVLAQNPILPIGLYIADPSLRVWDDGKLYIYGSRDESTDHYCSHDHYVVSTHDLITWDIKKDVFASKGPNDKVPYNDALLFAPDCIYRDGKYYLYYCQPYPKSPEGVAVSNHPEGPFGVGKAIDLHGYNQIDPAVFKDDDGQFYYLWGQFTLKMAKLNADMTSIDESTLNANVISESEHFFHEGAFMAKRNGIYYIVYADLSRAGRPTCIGYATSDKPFGPYTYQGVIIDNDGCDPATWNNHGSIVEFKNKWYVAYHRSTHGSVMMRRTCMEPITFNEDGTIPEVEMTSQGVGAPLNAFENIEAERACLLHGQARFQLWNDNNEEIGGIARGDRAAYKYIDFGQGGVKTMQFVVRAGSEPGAIVVNIGKPWHKKIAQIDVPAKKDNEEWITVSAPVEEVSGVHELWFSFTGKGENMYSIDKFRFVK